MAMAGGMPSMLSTCGLSMRSKKLAGVGRKGLDVAALALGEEGVEGEGAFAGTAQAGDDDELVEMQIEVEILRLLCRTPRRRMARRR